MVGKREMVGRCTTSRTLFVPTTRDRDSFTVQKEHDVGRNPSIVVSNSRLSLNTVFNYASLSSQSLTFAMCKRTASDGQNGSCNRRQKKLHAETIVIVKPG